MSQREKGMCLLSALLVLFGGTAAGRAAEPTPDGIEFFEKKVRPVLVENCHQCHSAAGKQRAHLFLDSRSSLLKGGDTGPAITPGQPENSLLVKAIGYQDTDLRMPPRGKLSEEQIADLTTWVKLGAPWPETTAGRSQGEVPKGFDLQERRRHWAWQPLQHAVPPPVQHADWPRTPVDQFVLARLEAAGLTPAPAADRRTLLRRVTYDLIGLPPTPAEIDAFLADSSPDAYEKVVERLLASPHYGERWARHWLDLVRFAETCGHEFDFEIPEAHVYRDYVIRAFNEDVPYNQFVLEHMAGDLLPQPRRHPTEHFNESIIGTGFWFLGEGKHSPVDVRGDQADRLDNQVDVFGKTFLGLTLACARCHDHKFDAISQKDYYALIGYLQSSRRQVAVIDPPEPTRDLVRRLREVQDEARTQAVAASATVLEERAGRVARYLLASRAASFDPGEDEQDAAGIDAWIKGLRHIGADQTTHPLYPWRMLANVGEELTPEEFTARRKELLGKLQAQVARAAGQDGRQVLFADFRPGYQDWFVTGAAFGTGPTRAGDVSPQMPHTPVRSLLPPGMAHSGLISGKLEGALRSRTFILDKSHILYHVAGKGARINLIIDGYQLIRSPIYGGLTIPIEHGERLEWRSQDVAMWRGHRAYIEILDEGGGFIALDKILFSDDGPPPEGPNSLVVKMLDDPTLTSAAALARKYEELFHEMAVEWREGRLDGLEERGERVRLLNWMLQDNLFAVLPAHQPDASAREREVLARLEAALPSPRHALAMADGTGINERLHIRGNHKNLGEEVPRRFLEAIGGSDQAAPAEGSGRLELAQRMVDSSDPLLPRVLVNRLWQHHFGEGLVRSPDNFGVLGERPTHPELLDYLAGEFVRQGWSIKQMHRLLVLSQTYRMASQGDEHAEELDPQNRLLHRMPVRRLEAEAIRDAILAISGRLDDRMYGPGVLPHLTPFMTGRGRPASGPLDGEGRRSIYINVRRNFLEPLFLAFDYPIPFTTMGRRSVSNVPAQALALMNNPFVVQQAERWAKRSLAEPGLSTEQRITGLYVTAFGRPPTEDEVSAARAFLNEQGKQYGQADDPRAWADLCHVLLNVKAFIFVN